MCWDENKVNAGEMQQNVDEVCHGVISMTDPSRSQRMDQSKYNNSATGLEIWLETSTADVLKINTDDAFVRELRTGARGFIIRDHLGELVLA